MSWGKLFFWSTVLTLPTLFMFPKKREPGVVEPGPETTGPDGEPVVTEPSSPPEPFPPLDLNINGERLKVVNAATFELGSGDAAKYWASASPRVNMLGADWCGAFALWALHEAGLATDWVWEPGLGFLMTRQHKLPTTKNPEPGDIAYFDKNQHEAVVASVEPGGLVHLVNGNGVGGVVTASSVSPSAVTAFFSITPLLSGAA